MKSIIRAVAGCALAWAFAGCGGDSSNDAVCGDLVCDSGESASSCAQDFACGNGIVNTGEVREKFAADGADPAPPVSVDRFRGDYGDEVSKWEKFTRNMKVKL